MLPSDFKRKYKFRTDTSKEKKYFKIVLIVTFIILIILWYFMK